MERRLTERRLRSQQLFVEDKEVIRKEIRRRKRLATAEELAAQSRCLMERLLVHPRILLADVILMYHALPDEVDTTGALDFLLDSGKCVLLPTVIGAEEMVLHEYTGRESLREGAFHIMEPVGECFEDYASIDVAVVPGMAFDAGNNRLGRGKGYYDRFLARVPAAYKIGVCFDFQRLAMLPASEFDVRMDEVLSAAGGITHSL